MSGIISFTKMHGLGNDFVVIDGISQSVSLSPADIIYISNRRRGIGCDQILLVQPSDTPDIDFLYKIYNSDGSEAGQCGNGARCLAKFIRDKNLSTKKILRVKTLTSLLELWIEDENIRVNMGVPEDITVETRHSLVSTRLSLGNPHIVFQTPDIQNHSLHNFGLNDFNIGFMQIVHKNHIKLRVFERGAGETEACGSGACAAVIAGIVHNLLDPAVTVELPGGKLYIDWEGLNHPVWMTGPAETVFNGNIVLP